MRSHHRMEGECFVKHDDMQLDNELNINQCSPNLNCRMIVEMLFPLGRAHERLTIAKIFQRPDWKERNRGREKTKNKITQKTQIRIDEIRSPCNKNEMMHKFYSILRVTQFFFGFIFKKKACHIRVDVKGSHAKWNDL